MKNTFFVKLFLLWVLTINIDILCADKDLYKVLNLPRNASQNEIKKRYREYTKLYHPDKNQQNKKEATDKFAEVAEAYEILSDEKKRRKYDRGGMDAVNVQNQNQGFDPFNVFGMFGGQKQGGEKREDDVRIKLRTSLKDLYLGREYEVYLIYKY